MGKTIVLFLAANPLKQKRLSLDAEIREIAARLREADNRNIELKSAWAVTPGDLQKLLLEDEPDVVHFSSHGNPSGELVLQGHDGPQAVNQAAVKNLFAIFKDRIRLVVLNACHSVEQAKAITGSIDCAIGMNRAVGDEAAIVFAAAFYGGLADEPKVHRAFLLGKNALELAGIPESDTPEIFYRAGVDAETFTLAPLVERPPHVVDGGTDEEGNGELSLDTTPCTGKLKTFRNPYVKRDAGTVVCNGKPHPQTEVEQR